MGFLWVSAQITDEQKNWKGSILNHQMQFSPEVSGWCRQVRWKAIRLFWYSLCSTCPVPLCAVNFAPINNLPIDSF